MYIAIDINILENYESNLQIIYAYDDKYLLRLLFRAKYETHLVGSSKNITGGLLTNSRAMESLFFWPPLRFEVMVWRCSDKPRVSRISWIWKGKCQWIISGVRFRYANWLLGSMIRGRTNASRCANRRKEKYTRTVRWIFFFHITHNVAIWANIWLHDRMEFLFA